MPPVVLVIEAEDRVFSVVELALGKHPVELVREPDIARAKRRLLQHVPALILCHVALDENQEAGFQFAKELSEHPELRQVPVLLVSDRVHDTVLQKAHESGAKGLIPWPLKVELLRQRILALLPKEVPQEKPVPTTPPISVSSSAVQAPTAPIATSENTKVLVPPLAEERLRHAKAELQKVLQALAGNEQFLTSEHVDISEVIFDTTAAVLKIKRAEPSVSETAEGKREFEERTKSEEKKQKPSKRPSEFNPDAIFGRKK